MRCPSEGTAVTLGQSAAVTDPGRRRRHNEDAYVCEPPLFAVADGIGGAQAGELASSLAAAAVRDDSSDGRGDGRRRVDELIQEANRRVYQRQSEDASLSGMGTTMTVALFEEGHVWIGHVGDSRAYLHRDDLRATAKALVRAANKGGGEDNITVVFFELQADEHAGERTVVLPPPEEEAGAETDDDTTLDELDAVPTVQTARRGRERKEHPVRRRVVFVSLLLLLVLVAGALGVWGLWRSHFVGAEPDGHVAVYQGVPWNIAGNVHLYRTVYESPLLTAQLSRSERKELFDHNLRSESSAMDEVRSYEEQLGR